MGHRDKLLAKAIGCSVATEISPLALSLVQMSYIDGIGLPENSFSQQPIRSTEFIFSGTPADISDRIVDCHKSRKNIAVKDVNDLFHGLHKKAAEDKKITKQEIFDFFSFFAKGLHYVHEKYGYSPKSIIISDNYYDCNGFKKEDFSVSYWPDGDAVVLNAGFIINMIFHHRHNGIERSQHTGYLPVNDLLTCLGIEEAYHAYQHHRCGDKYKYARNENEAESIKRQIGGAQFYNEDPLEADAKVAIQKAMKDLKLGAGKGK